MSAETLPGVHPNRLLRALGQAWLTARDVEVCGYAGEVGEVVRVQPGFGHGDVFYELAALLPAQKVGLAKSYGFVWWFQRMKTEVDDVEISTGTVDATATGERR